MRKRLYEAGWLLLVAGAFVMCHIVNIAPQPAGTGQFHINLNGALVVVDLAALAGLYQLGTWLKKTGFALLVVYCAARLYTLNWILYSYSDPRRYAHSFTHVTVPGVLTLVALGCVATNFF